MIGLNKTDDKTDHGPARSYNSVGDGLGSGKKILKSIAAISFSIDKTALIQPPAFVEL
jgi:hypothetical protein